MAHFCRYCRKPFSRAHYRDRHEGRGCSKSTDSKPVGGATMADGFQEVSPYAPSEDRSEDEELNQDEG